MHDDADAPIPFRVTPLGQSVLGEKTLRFGAVSGSRVVLDPGVFLPNYDRGEVGGTAVDQMPNYEAES